MSEEPPPFDRGPGQPPAPPPPPPPGAAPAPAAAPPPAPPPPTQTDQAPDQALLHDTEQTRTYPCRQCGGELECHIGEQGLKCPHCGSSQEIPDDGDVVIENDFREALRALEAGADARTGTQVAGEKEVVCQNCGGHTTFSGSLTATRCPYCATPIQRDDVHEAPARLAVDGVMPFEVDPKAAKDKIEEWIKSRWFAPNEFKKYATTGSFNSVYTAYFTYDADTHSHYTGRRGDHYTVTVGHGENRRTETRTRWTSVSGSVANTFDDMPVLANEGLERRHVDKLEPWPTERARPFRAEYLAGHLSRTYDHDVGECFHSAKARMEDSIRSTVRRDIGGDQQQITSLDVHWRTIGYKHLLLPVWLLTVLYAGAPFQVFINGITGEVQGQRPFSKVKIAVAVIAALIVIGVLIAVFAANGDTGST